MNWGALWASPDTEICLVQMKAEHLVASLVLYWDSQRDTESCLVQKKAEHLVASLVLYWDSQRDTEIHLVQMKVELVASLVLHLES